MKYILKTIENDPVFTAIQTNTSSVNNNLFFYSIVYIQLGVRNWNGKFAQFRRNRNSKVPITNSGTEIQKNAKNDHRKRNWFRFPDPAIS